MAQSNKEKLSYRNIKKNIYFTHTAVLTNCVYSGLRPQPWKLSTACLPRLAQESKKTKQLRTHAQGKKKTWQKKNTQTNSNINNSEKKNNNNNN